MSHSCVSQGRGWFRVGSSISYHQSSVIGREGPPQYTLTFTLTLPHDDDVVHLAHCYPYSYTHLIRQGHLCVCLMLQQSPSCIGDQTTIWCNCLLPLLTPQNSRCTNSIRKNLQSCIQFGDTGPPEIAGKLMFRLVWRVDTTGRHRVTCSTVGIHGCHCSPPSLSLSCHNWQGTAFAHFLQNFGPQHCSLAYIHISSSFGK